MSFTVRLIGTLTALAAALTVFTASSIIGSILHEDLSYWSPHHLPGWWRFYGSDQGWVFWLGTVGGLLWFMPAILLARLGLAWHTPPVTEVGTSEWADFATAKRAGLTQTRGVVVGRWGTYNARKPAAGLLAYDGPEHQLVAGGTRSGKGVGHVIPSLLNWPGGALIYDIKGELWEKTAGFRGRFGHALRFNPTKPGSGCRYNPLLEIRRDHMVRDAQNLAAILVDPSGAKQSLDIWDQSAAQFLTALILHVLLTEPDDKKHLGRVRELLLDFENTASLMQRTLHIEHPKTGQPIVHPEIALSAKSLLEHAERFRSSVKGSAEQYLSLWADPAVVEATSASDWCASDLMVCEKPVSVYIQPPPSDADRLRPLVRLMLYQTSRTLMEDLDHDNRGREKKHKLLLTLDEFPTLGGLPFISDNLRLMAGYGLKAHLIVQSFADIAAAYGHDNTIIDNCHIIVAFSAADTTSARRISDMTGQVIERRRSFSKRRLSPFSIAGRTESESEQMRPLLTPGEVRKLRTDQQLIFVSGTAPMRTHKVRYYEDAFFTPRLLPEPEADHPDLPPDSVSSLDWFGVRAFDVLPLNHDNEDEHPNQWFGVEDLAPADEPPADESVASDPTPPPTPAAAVPPSFPTTPGHTGSLFDDV